MAETAYVKSYVSSHNKRKKVRSPMSGYKTGHKKKKKYSTGGTKHVVASKGGSL